MTLSTSTMTPSAAVQRSSMKPFARRSSATGSTKFRSSAGLFAHPAAFGGMSSAVSDEIRKARDQVLGYKAVAAQYGQNSKYYTSAEQRAQRCHSLVSEALNVMQDEEADFSLAATSSSSCATPATRVVSAPQNPLPSAPAVNMEDLGYGDDSAPAATTTKSSSSNEDLGYGYERSTSDPISLGKATFGSNRRRYQRRCSVTEFSLKAAVLAKVQYERQQRQHHRRASN